jgi:dienelactone hydrolase
VNAFHFTGGNRARLFGIHHAPPDGERPAHGIVLCHPVAHEYMAAYRTLRIVARELALRGFDVLRFDHQGTGDSAGDLDEGSRDLWREDTLAAMGCLRNRIGPNRMNVGPARRLAAMGHPCVRFDFSWVGDREPRDDGFPMRRAAVEEARAVLDTLSEEIGSTSFVVGGLCSGADAPFRVALADDRVFGCVFIDGFPYRNLGWYWHHYARRLLRSPARNVGSVHRAVARLGARFEGGGRRPAPDLDRDVPSRSGAARGLRRLAHRGVRMCVIFSEGQLDWYNHAGQFEATFRSAGLQGPCPCRVPSGHRPYLHAPLEPTPIRRRGGRMGSGVRIHRVNPAHLLDPGAPRESPP